MPKSPQHSKQKKKNITLFMVLLSLILLIYAISLMRMGFRIS